MIKIMGFRGLGLGSGPTVSTSVLSPVKWSETLCFPVVFHGESELCTLSSVHSEWPEINVKRGTHCWCQAQRALEVEGKTLCERSGKHQRTGGSSKGTRGQEHSWPRGRT